MNKKVIFIGPAGGGRVPQNGASAKNYHLMNYFHKKNINVVSVDTENWRKNPLVLVKLVFLILLNPNAKYIIATNNMSSYRVLQIMSLFPRKRSIIYWIIGGSIADWIKEGKVKVKPFKIVDVFLAEGKKCRRLLRRLDSRTLFMFRILSVLTICLLSRQRLTIRCALCFFLALFQRKAATQL